MLFLNNNLLILPHHRRQWPRCGPRAPRCWCWCCRTDMDPSSSQRLRSATMLAGLPPTSADPVSPFSKARTFVASRLYPSCGGGPDLGPRVTAAVPGPPPSDRSLLPGLSWGQLYWDRLLLQDGWCGRSLLFVVSVSSGPLSLSPQNRCHHDSERDKSARSSWQTGTEEVETAWASFCCLQL